MNSASPILPSHFTLRILFAIGLGALCGIGIKMLPLPEQVFSLIYTILHTAGLIFIELLKMLVIPVVFVSLVCGVSALKSLNSLGRIGIKTLLCYVFTTVIALTLGLSLATMFNIGSRVHFDPIERLEPIEPLSAQSVILDMVPSNPIQAMATSNMMQIIIFALLFGMAMMLAGKEAAGVRHFFVQLNSVVMRLVFIVMIVAPYGIFFILSSLFAKQGLEILLRLAEYFVLVAVGLLLHLFVTYALILKVIGKLKIKLFYQKMLPAMFFAFGVSSSSASIPVVLEVVEEKLGVDNRVASFVVPLGATMNMDGTALMQGMATVFIAHAYQIDIGIVGYLTVMVMATLASIGTAGVPSVGLITLTMVLNQVGLPSEGISLIIGIDRLLDMLRTAVNISGDAMISCVVANSEGLLDHRVYTARR